MSVRVPRAMIKFFSRLFIPTGNKRLNELVGFLLFVSAILLLLALASYSPLDPSFNTASTASAAHPAQNFLGIGQVGENSGRRGRDMGLASDDECFGHQFIPGSALEMAAPTPTVKARHLDATQDRP